jgi:methyltransferase (TIGR00027 family)
LPDAQIGSEPCSDDPSIRDVSDTALWVAVYRAMESERPDALFRDPFARRMAGERGKRIAASIPFGQAMAWSIIVRTAVIDEVILRCVGQGVHSVLNLGAGLDTRAFRLPLPPSLRWLDVDLPAMTAYRQECLKAEVASCQHVHVAADLSIAADLSRTLADARTRAGPLLVLTEGLLVYLTPSQVCSLAKQLRLDAQAQWWVADLISPLLRKTMGAIWRSQLGSAQAAFEFAPQDSRVFFEAVGWQEHEFHSTWSNAFRLGRPPPHGAAWDALWKWTAPAAQEALKRMSGVALFRRAP